MRSLSARVKRGLPLAIAATAALAVPASAGAALQAGAPAYSPLSGPVPVSGSVDQALNQAKVCYDRQIKTNTTDNLSQDASALLSSAFNAVQPDGTTALFSAPGVLLGLDVPGLLNGIQAGGSLLGAPSSARISASPADGGKCVVLGFDPSQYLGGTTLLSAKAHAVEDLSNEPSLPGSVTVSGGDFTAASPVLAGQGVGNMFTGVKSLDPNSNTITLSSNQPIDPASVLNDTAQGYEIFFPGGRHVTAETVTVGSRSVTVKFPDSNPDGPINVQQAVFVVADAGVVNTKSIVSETTPQNPIAPAFGAFSLSGNMPATFPLQESASLAAARSVRPIAQKVDRVGPKSWVFTYDQSDLTLVSQCPLGGNQSPEQMLECARAAAIAVDGTVFPATAIQKLNDQQVIVSFAGITNPAEIVEVADGGGLVRDQENLYMDAKSIPTVFNVAANHNLGAGYTVGPDLTGAIKQPTTLANPDTSSVEATFDSALNLTDVHPADIMLIERDGSMKTPIGLIDAYNTNDNVGHVVLQYRKSYVDQAVGIVVNNNTGAFKIPGIDQTISPDGFNLCGGYAVSDLYGNLNSLGTSGFVALQQPTTTPQQPTTSQSQPAAISAPSLAPASVQTVIKKAIAKKVAKKHKAAKKHKKAKKHHAKKRRRAAVTGRRR